MIGRDKELELLERRLEENSILFVAERRIGKTTVLKALKERLAENLVDSVVVFSDLESVSTPFEFVDKIYSSVSSKVSFVEKALFFSSKAFSSTKENIESIKSVKFKSRSFNWKKHLENVITELCQKTAGKVIFLWDEVPYMLKNIQDKHSENIGLEILDKLRELRQTNNNLRMVYTGSVGIHHILKDLKQSSASQPINDLCIIELLPISEGSAKELIDILFEKESLGKPCEDVVLKIMAGCDCVPFYITKLIYKMSDSDKTVSVDSIISDIIHGAADEFQMEHFKDRLKDYYIGRHKDYYHAEIAKNLLDIIAEKDSPISINECFNLIKSAIVIDDKDVIIELLSSLAKDFYITNHKGSYTFKFSLIRKWWLASGAIN